MESEHYQSLLFTLLKDEELIQHCRCAALHRGSRWRNSNRPCRNSTSRDAADAPRHRLLGRGPVVRTEYFRGREVVGPARHLLHDIPGIRRHGAGAVHQIRGHGAKTQESARPRRGRAVGHPVRPEHGAAAGGARAEEDIPTRRRVRLPGRERQCGHRRRHRRAQYRAPVGGREVAP